MTENDMRSLDGFDESIRRHVANLRSDDPTLRAHALNEIGAGMNDAVARALIRFATDATRQDQERGLALIALGPALEECFLEEADDGSFVPPPPGTESWWGEPPLSEEGYREVVEELGKIHQDGALPELVRRRALEAAVRAPRPWQRQATEVAWRSKDPEWRLTAVFAMGYLEGFDNELRDAFYGDEPELRREAMRAAGRGLAGETLAEGLLEVAADTKSPAEDRLAAIDAIAELAPEGAFEILDELTADREPAVAEAAEAALEEIVILRSTDDELPDLTQQ